MDGIQPDCHSAGSGCIIPPLPAAAVRIMDIRDKLIRLQRLKIGSVICSIYGVTSEDLELLAITEDELNPKEDQDNGTRCDVHNQCEG